MLSIPPERAITDLIMVHPSTCVSVGLISNLGSLYQIFNNLETPCRFPLLIHLLNNKVGYTSC